MLIIANATEANPVDVKKVACAPSSSAIKFCSVPKFCWLVRPTEFPPPSTDDNNESTIFHALTESNDSVGFVQLYETFGSLDLGKIIILYDLYVIKDYRKKNIGKQLMLKSHANWYFK